MTVLETEKFIAQDVGGDLQTQTVSAIQNHPEINYVVVTYDPAAADQVSAIRQAGIEGVTVVSCLGNEQNLSFVANDDIQRADACWDNVYLGWAIVDQLIRLFNGQPLAEPHGENCPFGMVDKTNLPSDIAADWVGCFEYKSIFLDMWGVK